MPITPVLSTTRLHLAPLQRSDAGDVFAYASNPNMSLHVPWETHRSVSDAEAFLDVVFARGPDEHTWGIRLDAAGPLVGVIELGLLAADEADVHFVLAEPYWNRGLMTEAVRCVIGWGFAAYPALDRIVSNAATGNAASRRVMEKCGMRLEATRFDRWAKRNQPVELAVYALARADWRAG